MLKYRIADLKPSLIQRNAVIIPRKIAHFIEYVKQQDGIEYASQVMVDYRNKALDVLPESISKELKAALTSFIDYVIERKK